MKFLHDSTVLLHRYAKLAGPSPPRPFPHSVPNTPGLPGGAPSCCGMTPVERSTADAGGVGLKPQQPSTAAQSWAHACEPALACPRCALRVHFGSGGVRGLARKSAARWYLSCDACCDARPRWWPAICAHIGDGQSLVQAIRKAGRLGQRCAGHQVTQVGPHCLAQ